MKMKMNRNHTNNLPRPTPAQPTHHTTQTSHPASHRVTQPPNKPPISNTHNPLPIHTFR